MDSANRAFKSSCDSVVCIYMIYVDPEHEEKDLLGVLNCQKTSEVGSVYESFQMASSGHVFKIETLKETEEKCHQEFNIV